MLSLNYTLEADVNSFPHTAAHDYDLCSMMSMGRKRHNRGECRLNVLKSTSATFLAQIKQYSATQTGT